jgi:hypothetical protein
MYSSLPECLSWALAPREPGCSINPMSARTRINANVCTNAQTELTHEAVQVGVSSRSAAWPFASDKEARTHESSGAAPTSLAGAGFVPFWISALKSHHGSVAHHAAPLQFWHHLLVGNIGLALHSPVRSFGIPSSSTASIEMELRHSAMGTCCVSPPGSILEGQRDTRALVAHQHWS